MGSMPIIGVRSVTMVFHGRSGSRTLAVDDVSLEVAAGETLVIVGESGSGKSTLARLIVGLETPTTGTILFEGSPLRADSLERRRQFARKVQLVFQSASYSLNPLKTVGRTLEDPLRAHGWPAARRAERLRELLKLVELSPFESFVGRYPKQLSGGQRQRVIIARAMALGPSLLVADEPVSSLDMPVRNQILNLMLTLLSANSDSRS